MKKILITSEKFAGEIQVVYADDFSLLSIDFSMAQLNLEQIGWIKNRIPAQLYAEFNECFLPAKLNIVMEGYEVTFDMFWNAYDEKLNRIRCEKIWEKMSKADRQLAYAGIPIYNRHLKNSGFKNKANPDTYLRIKYWQNEWK